ncbi:MAG: hypothetical protein K6G88_05680 [Lachnospiraceae bacterium]|nr:hypothetical protein [Lachnospiraceae bacterium]
MKYFISQPMKDKAQEEIKEQREQIIAAIKEEDEEAVIIDSFFEDYDPQNGCIPLKYLSKSLELLADADILYCAKGWEEARGCKIEHDCALAYEITVVEENKKSPMPTREKAVEILYEIINSGILDEELEVKIQDIASCIAAEDDNGIFIWGAEENDWIDLYVSKMDPYNSSVPYNTDELKKEYDKWIEHCKSVYEKYKIKEEE